MANFSHLPAGLERPSSFQVFDDFNWLVTAHNWTTLVADGGTSATVSTTFGGVVPLVTGATDNNEAAVYMTNAQFLLAANSNTYGEIRAKYAEANTDDANVFLGFASAPGANLLVDDGAGPRTSGTIIGFYKVDGGTAWICYTRSNSVVYSNTTQITAGSTAYAIFGIEIVELNSLTATVVFKIDGQLLRDATTGAVIRHNIAVASATAMGLVAYVKAGGANSETLNVDYMGATAARVLY